MLQLGANDMAIRVLLADDHRLFRSGLRSLLQQRSDMEVVGEAEDGREAAEMAASLVPDVVIMDITMPGLNGMEATRQIASRHPQVKVIALSVHSDRRFVENMLKAGASGYLLKDSSLEEVVRAIKAVLDNQTYLSPAIAGIVVEDLLRRPPAEEGGRPSLASLSSREREVLQLLAEGLSTKQIAARLFLSSKTVETHRRHIMEKTATGNLAELTKFAIREGITSLDPHPRP